MATRSSVLAWRIPGTEEPDGLPVAQSQTRLNRLSSSSSNNGMKRILERWPPCKTFHLDINATTLDGFSNLKANNDIFRFKSETLL